MLTSLFELARSWIVPPIPTRESNPHCVPEWSEEMAERHAAIWWNVKPYTQASAEQMVAQCQSIAYLEQRRIPGAIVHCGVDRGGSVMAAALALLALDSTKRQLYLFDKFAGPALNDVKQSLMLTRYPWEKFRFVSGPIDAAMPTPAPHQIALLRLDNDGFESTYQKLKHFYPRVVDGGILIMNSFGDWQGAQRAIDTYFREQGVDAELRMIDNGGRLVVKCEREIAMSFAA